MSSQAEQQKAQTPGNIPVSRAVNMFLLFGFGLLGVFVCVLIGIIGSREFSQMQRVEHRKRVNVLGHEITTYADNRLAILHDHASLPAVVQAVMQPEMNKANIADFMDALSVLGEKPQMILLDFAGTTIHKTRKEPVINHSGCAWISRIIDGTDAQYAGIIMSRDIPYWWIGVPVQYNGKAEGVLAVCIPLQSMAESMQLTDKLHNEGVMIRHGDTLIAAFGSDDSKGACVQVDLDRFGLTLNYRGNATRIVDARNRLVLSVIGAMVLVTLLVAYVASRLAHETFVLPLQRLRETAVSISKESSKDLPPPSLSRVMEISLLETDFRTMAERVEDRESKLEMANAHLEERVEERTLALRNSEARLNSILEGTGAGTWEWNVQTGETIFNERWASIVGWTLEDLAPVSIQTWLGMAHPDDLKASEALLKKHFSGDVPTYDIECRMRHRGGHWVWVHDRGKVASWTKDGKPGWMYGTHMDITKRKRAEDELAMSRKALEKLNRTLEEKVEERTRELRSTQSQMVMQEKLASVGQLAAGVAHELNNPIGFLMNNFAALEDDVELFRNIIADYRGLLSKAKAVPSLKEAVSHLEQKEREIHLDFTVRDIEDLFAESRDGFARTMAIVGSMRDLARSEKVDEKAEYNINDAIRSTLVLARNEYKYHSEVDVEYGDIPPVVCQPSQINQVFLNLVVNAAQAIAGQGRKSKGTIVIRSYATDAAVCCDVSDDGPGIPEDILDKVFEPFFTTKPPGKGTGLGLGISYDIVVNRHGGSLTVDSSMGKGALFKVCLPLHVAEDANSTKVTS